MPSTGTSSRAPISPWRRALAALATVTLVAAGVVALPAQEAEAVRATGGSARFPDVEWISWGAHGTGLDPGSTTSITTTEEFTRGGTDYVVTCSLTNIRRTRGTTGGKPYITAYTPGDWRGDGLDDLYNIGGTGKSNKMAIGIRNRNDGNTIQFSVSCSATVNRGGVVSSFPLAGLVMASGESSVTAGTVREHVAATISGSSRWRILDHIKVVLPA